MQHGEEPEPRAKPLWVGGYSQQGFTHGAEHQIVNHPRILPGKLSDRIRQSEHDVIVSDRQQLLLSVLEPLGFGKRLTLGTVAIAAGVIHRHAMAAVRALVQMPAKRGGPTLSDGSHHSALLSSDKATVLLKESFAVPIDHIGEFN